MLSRIFVPPDDIDDTSNAVRVDLLSLPHATLKDIFVDGKSIAPANYTLHDKDIRLSGDARVAKSSKIWAYVDIPTKRIRNERYAAIAAIIGAAGAIAAAVIQSGWLDLSPPPEMTDFVTFKPDPYAVNAESGTSPPPSTGNNPAKEPSHSTRRSPKRMTSGRSSSSGSRSRTHGKRW